MFKINAMQYYKNQTNFITISAEELYKLRKKLIISTYSNAK